MKPIQTYYKGYKFRSRTEARWAVFFDSVGVDWEYEPEGFVLSDGSHYLPDFKVTYFDRGLIEGGVQLGVSSRGVGSISSRGGINEVQDDFRLATVDLVANPSAKSALVQGIYEGAEWVYENGIWQQSMIEEAKTQIDKLYTEEVALQIFQKFMASLRA
jgi:hypothetical protein